MSDRQPRRTTSQNFCAAITQSHTGGLLLLAATITALIWANSAVADNYFQLRDTVFGIPDFTIAGFTVHGVMLPLGHWASDGLLTLFFFVAGLELKQECVTGELRKFSKAVVPIVAAVGGVIVPAVLYVLVNTTLRPDVVNGWAIPTATDIAFAVSALALAGSFLPRNLRTFLLTLAVIDDLIAIIIIAVFYSDNLQLGYLGGAAITLAIFASFARRGISAWFVLLPPAILTWYFIHEAGIHATIAGVLLSFTIPMTNRRSSHNAEPARLTARSTPVTKSPIQKNGNDVAERARLVVEPVSVIVAVPLFAFFSAGIALHGWEGMKSAITNPLTLSIIAALVLGKACGVIAATVLATRLTPVQLRSSLQWLDLTGLAFLTGIGFTVSLLLSELSFGSTNIDNDYAKIGVLCGSLVAALIGITILSIRNRWYKRRTPEST